MSNTMSANDEVNANVTIINDVSVAEKDGISVEDGIFNLASEKQDVREINLPRSEVGWFQNSRKQNLHFRMYYKHHEPIKAVIFYFHGYAAHANRPTYSHFIEECMKMNYCLVCLDFHGHGYSEGTRAYVDDQTHLLDDATCLIREIYHAEMDLHECHFNEHHSGHHKHRSNSKAVATEQAKDTKGPVFNLRRNQVPFYIMGQSMGGAVSVRLGLYYQSLCASKGDYQSVDSDATCTSGMSWFGGVATDIHKNTSDANFATCFAGAILLAPAISGNLPPPLVRMVFENVLVPFFPAVSIPKALSGGVDDNTTIWNSEKFVEYSCVKDKHHPDTNPNGLSFGESIRFKTAYTLVQMMQTISSELSSIAFPFIIFHDPNDAVTQYNGSLRLVNESSTSVDKKHLYSLPNAKHDLFTNRLSVIVKKTIEWIHSEQGF